MEYHFRANVFIVGVGDSYLSLRIVRAEPYRLLGVDDCAVRADDDVLLRAYADNVL